MLLKLGGDLFDPALVSTKERRMLDEALIAQRIRMAQDTSCAATLTLVWTSRAFLAHFLSHVLPHARHAACAA